MAVARLGDGQAVEYWLAKPQAPLARHVLGEAAARLSSETATLLRLFVECTGYDKSDAEQLWQDQQLYIESLIEDLSTRATPVMGARPRSQQLVEVPFGRVLVCLPANAPIPLAAICAFCSVAGGNRTVFTRPRRTGPLVDGVLDIVDDDCLAIFTESPRVLVGRGLESFDAVYFMGPSSAYPGLAAAAATAGCDLVFEGQGNVFALVSDTLDDTGMRHSVDELLRSKAFCNGQMCSAPNTLLVAERFLERFVDLWTRHAPAFVVPRIGDLLSPGSRAWLTSPERRVPVDGEAISRATEPTLVAVAPDDVPPVEFFCPLAAIAPVPSDAAAIEQMGRSRYKLQGSVFAGDSGVVAAVSALGFARVTSGFCPSDQDPLAPWGNFGASGYSAVRTFRDKFVRTQLLEVAE